MNVEVPVFIRAKGAVYLPQFERDIAVLALTLQNNPQQRWALCFNDSYRFTVALFAVLATHKQPVLLPNNQSGTLAVLQNEYDAILSDLPDIVVTPLKPAAGETVLQAFVLSDLQTITFFTSGSTGTPKKVQRSLTALRKEIKVLEALFGADLQDAKIYSSVSHQHIYGLLFYVLWPLYAGRSIVSPLLQYPENLETLFKRTEKIVLISSPTLLSRLDFKLDLKLKPIIFTSGGLLKDSSAQILFANLGLMPIEILGSTETSGVAFRQQIKQPLWQALPEVLLGRDLTTGCLSVQSPFFDEQTTLVMGDQVEMNSQGLFKLIGRADRIVKIEGKRLSLIAIEQKIKEHRLVADVQVLKLDAHRQLLAAVIILNEPGKALLQEQGKRQLDLLLQTWLLPFYEAVLCPKKIRYVDSWPLNEQGKTTQLALQELFDIKLKRILSV